MLSSEDISDLTGETDIQNLTGVERELVEKLYRIIDQDYVRTGVLHHKRVQMVLKPILTQLAYQGIAYADFVNSDIWCGCNEQQTPKE